MYIYDILTGNPSVTFPQYYDIIHLVYKYILFSPRILALLSCSFPFFTPLASSFCFFFGVNSELHAVWIWL